MNDDWRLNDGVKVGFENWLNDNIGFRESFVQIASWVKYDIFHKKSNDKVEVGRDGWFFYKGDNNLQIAHGTYPLTEEQLEAIRVNQEAVQKRLAKQGIEYVLVLPTSKVSIYPEMLLSGDYAYRETPVDTVANYLEQTTDIKVVRLKDALLDEKERQQVFFKTDTHWNEVGAYTAYRTIISDMQKWDLVNIDPLEVSFVPDERKGEFSAMLGNVNLLEAEPYQAIKIDNPCAEQILDTAARIPKNIRNKEK